MNWKVGDIAVCIKVGKLGDSLNTEKPPSLRLNAEYIIQNIYQCPKCRGVAFDVGLGNFGDDGTQCCTETIPCKEIHWCASLRFAKKKTKEEQIAEAIEKEDYELADKLTNN